MGEILIASNNLLFAIISFLLYFKNNELLKLIAFILIKYLTMINPKLCNTY